MDGYREGWKSELLLCRPTSSNSDVFAIGIPLFSTVAQAYGPPAHSIIDICYPIYRYMYPIIHIHSHDIWCIYIYIYVKFKVSGSNFKVSGIENRWDDQISLPWRIPGASSLQVGGVVQVVCMRLGLDYWITNPCRPLQAAAAVAAPAAGSLVLEEKACRAPGQWARNNGLRIDNHT